MLPSMAPSPRTDPLRPLRPKAPLDTDAAPLLVIWEMTQACDLACVHCRASATPFRDRLELDTEEAKHLLDDVAAMGAPLLVLTGGDPAKRPDLVELVAHGTARGLTMALTPSGTGLTTRALLEGLKGAGLARLAVSVDGPDAATHDEFRRVKGSFADTMRILEEARSLEMPTQINTSLSPLNIGALDAMADLVERMGSVLWSVFVVVQTGRATRSLLLDADTLETTLQRLAELAETRPFAVKTTAAPHFRRVMLERKASREVIGLLDSKGVIAGPRSINDGSGFVFVSHRGDVYPSGFLPVRCGNVRKESLADVYREHPLFKSLRDPDQLKGKCGVCPFRHVCAGSRARAYAATGDPLESDPLCAYIPRAWAERERAASD